eukprot:6212512-Pleurochrysis_carterae.AAC.3
MVQIRKIALRILQMISANGDASKQGRGHAERFWGATTRTLPKKFRNTASRSRISRQLLVRV